MSGASSRAFRGRTAAALAYLALALALAALMPGRRAIAQVPAVPRTAQPPTPPPAVKVPQTVPQPPPAPAGRVLSWLNPATAPFLPVPEIAVDPDSGSTLGIIPTWLKTDENDHIRQMIAPDIIHNTYFGWGVHGRIYDYPSADEQWALTAEAKQRVERGVNAQYQEGRLRNRRWSVNLSLIYDRDGTPRFYGIGNHTPAGNQTNFTNEQELAQGEFGFNLSRAWQLQYTLLVRHVDVLPGTLARIPSTDALFPNVRGLHSTKEVLNRFAIIYDSRDDIVVPTRGVQWVVYGGLASRNGILNDSLFSEAGIDGRGFWTVAHNTILAAHTALRYMPQADHAPFWALSTLGGGQSVIGGGQPLRGYGAGRFYDRNAFSATVELRRKVGSVRIASSRLDLEVAPFLDVGRVFSRLGAWPTSELHKVFGVGFRGVARPFVVGYVDIGYGNEGTAVFTGIGYPF